MNNQQFLKQVALVSNIRSIAYLADITNISRSVLYRMHNPTIRVHKLSNKTLLRFKALLEGIIKDERADVPQITRLLSQINQTVCKHLD